MNHLAEEVCPLGGTSSHVRNVLDFNPDAALNHHPVLRYQPLNIACNNFEKDTYFLLCQGKLLNAKEGTSQITHWKFPCELK